MFRSHDSGSLLPPISLWAVRLLALLALGLSAYLTVVSLDHAPLLGCSGGDTLDCDAVFNTGWSRVLGLPVAIPGVIIYAGILAATFGINSFHEPTQKQFLFLMVLFTTLAAGASMWFLGLQFGVIGKFCIFCCIVHTCGLTLAGFVFLPLISAASTSPANVGTVAGSSRAFVPAAGGSLPSIVSLTSLALPFVVASIGLATLIGIQVVFPTETFMTAKISDLGETISMDESDDGGGLGGGTEQNNDGPTSPSGSYTARRVNSGSMNALAQEPEKSTGIVAEESGNLGTGNLEAAQAELAEEEPEIPISSVPTLGRERVVSMLGGSLTFNVYKQAFVGSPEAEHVILELFDYTCPHCRKMHKFLKHAVREFDNEIVVVTMPVPLELKCNKLLNMARPENMGACKMAALALEMSKIDNAKFQGYHKWLMESGEDNARPLDKAVIKAFRLLPKAKTLRGVEKQEEVNARIQKHIKLYMAIAKRWEGEKRPGLPILIVKDQIMTGLPDDEESFCVQLETHLGVTRSP